MSPFARRLGLVVAASLALRAVYVLTIATGTPDFGDPLYYHVQANLLADGHGFAEPFVWLLEGGAIVPSAVHPPLYTLVLALPSLFGADGFVAHKLVSAVVASGGVALAGVLGRRLAGERAGIVAAGAVALSPNLWALDGILMPEGVYAVAVAGAVVAAYRLADAPTWRRAAVAGAAVGLATLARSEAILFVLLLLVPAAVRARRPLLLGAAGLALVVVVGPWVARNLTTFREPVLLSTNGDEVIRNANCDLTYRGPLIGFWSTVCYDVFPPESYDESERARYWRGRGLDYIRDHRSRVPLVVAARVGRVWDVYRPFQNVHLSTFDGRSSAVARAGLFYYWASIPLALYAVVVLRRRRVPVSPVLAPLAAVTVTAALAYGVVRFRAPADLMLAVLAGVALAHLPTPPRSRAPDGREDATVLQPAEVR